MPNDSVRLADRVKADLTALQKRHQKIVRDQGFCGALVDGGDAICILPANECEIHSGEVREQHGLRLITIDGVRLVDGTSEQEQLIFTETQDGAEVSVHAGVYARVMLDAQGLAKLACELTEWFCDDPVELVRDIKAAVTDLKEQLTDYNAKADEMGGDFEPFASMYNAAEAIDHRIDELGKVFAAVGGSSK